MTIMDSLTMTLPPPGEMNATIISDINRISITSKEWEALVNANETNTIFQTYEWFISWWKVFGDRNDLFFIKITSGGDLIGIAPLMISKAPSNRTMRFVSDDKADYCDFILKGRKSEALIKIFETIFSLEQRWDTIVLKNIPDYSSSTRIITEICKRNESKFRKSYITCPTLLIEGSSGNALSITRKKTERRRYNYFRKKGILRFNNIKAADEAHRSLDPFFAQHIKRRDLTRDKSLFLDPMNRMFYEELTGNIIDKGWLHFTVVEFNDHPIAYHYGFDYNSRMIWYKPSFDINYFKHSPGKVLLKYLIEYAVQNNKIEFDFTVGSEEFKQRFTNHQRKNTQMTIYKRTSQYIFDLSKNYLRNSLKIAMKGSKK